MFGDWVFLGIGRVFSQESWVAVLQRVLLLFPAVWFCMYQDRKISRLEKLEQHYTHKELIVHTYMAYQKKSSDVQACDPTWVPSLLKKTLDALYQAPSPSVSPAHYDILSGHKRKNDKRHHELSEA